MLACSRALRVCVLTCLACLRAGVLGVFACWRAWRVCLLACMACLRAYVLGVLAFLRACVLGVFAWTCFFIFLIDIMCNS